MTIVQKFKASELSAHWRQEFPDPGSRVGVLMREVDVEIEEASTLEEIIELVPARAGPRGLTADIAKEILAR